MSRMLSSFVMGSWAGFLAVSGLGEVNRALGRAELFGVELAVSGAGAAQAGILAAVLLGCSALMTLALCRVQSRDADKVRQGELVAFAGVGVCAAMVAAAVLFGAPFAAVFDRLDLAVWSVGLSLLALAFDAAIFEAEDEESEVAYRKSLLRIDATPRGRDRSGGGSDGRN